MHATSLIYRIYFDLMTLSVPGDLLDRKECVHYVYVGKDAMVTDKMH
jgi:hypothetical protein